MMGAVASQIKLIMFHIKIVINSFWRGGVQIHNIINLVFALILGTLRHTVVRRSLFTTVLYKRSVKYSLLVQSGGFCNILFMRN